MPMFILESVEVMDTYKRISGRPYCTETLKQLLSMEIAYNNTLRRIWHLPTYEDYLKQLLSMEIAYNSILRRSKDLTSPYAMPYEDSPSDCWFAQSRQSYNFTEVHFTEEILLY